MKKTGAILKEAREKKGISIYEVSTATKINTKNIMAMEEGNSDRLPPKTFLRGFVASYANFLQLDTNEILKIFFEEMGSTRPEVALRQDPRGDISDRTDKMAVAALTNNKKIGYFKIYGIVGIIILIVIIGLIKRKMDSYESESVPQTSAPPEMNAVGIPPTTPAATPAATPSASPTIDAAAGAALPITTPTATPVPTPEATATPTPTATPPPTTTPKPTATPEPSATPKPTPEPTPTPIAKPQDILIEALNDVDVDIQIDNGPSKKMTLHHDEVQSIKAKRKVSMKFSDGGAVNLTVNGKDKGVPGDLGKPKKVDLP